MRVERTHANRRERLHHLDKLGVAGSSPVPPIRKALLKGLSVASEGDERSIVARIAPRHGVR
jgi:hypothetical protein